MAFLFLLGLCIIQLIVIPRHIEIFHDFDTQLPSLTIRIISTPTAVFLAIYGLATVALIVKEAIPRLYPGIKLTLNLAVLLLCLVMYLVYAAALYLPMHQMMESLM